MDLSSIEIENDVKINDLYNNKYWIHGKTKENINITIFLITICGEQLKYSLKAINNLDIEQSVLVNVIMNIKPTNKAYNTMVERCTTKYFIQLDEDMEIYPNAINMVYNHLSQYKKNTKIFFYIHLN